MARLYQNFLGGLTDAALSNVGTTLSSPALAAMVAVAGGNEMIVVLDPDGIAGEPEPVKVTAHTASATTVTITRNVEGGTGRAHASGTDWVHALVASDLDVRAGTILAQTIYRPTNNASYSITSTAVGMADVDATNLAVTFIAPLSGKVNIELECLTVPPASATLFWGVREASALVAGTPQYVGFDSMNLGRARVTCPVTGLTPGTAYTYKWAAKVGSGTGTMYVGGDGAGSGANPYGTAVIRAIAAP